LLQCDKNLHIVVTVVDMKAVAATGKDPGWPTNTLRKPLITLW
jgi:hypothetical protein